LLIDPDTSVRAQAFKTINAFIKALEAGNYEVWPLQPPCHCRVGTGAHIHRLFDLQLSFT